MISEGSCIIFWCIYLVWVSQNAMFFMYFVSALNFLVCLGSLYILESPRYLFGMERFEDARSVLQKIAKRNGIKNYSPLYFHEEN